MGATRTTGTLALIGGGEWTAQARPLHTELIAAAGAHEIVLLPTAAAYEEPERTVEQAEAYFAELDLPVRAVRVLHRAEAEDKAYATIVADARLVYVTDGSPLHLRSVLKDSLLFGAMADAYAGGATIVASGAGATVLCDPMVDPRGGAYTVGLGLVTGLAVFPYHGTAADHLRERSIDLLAEGAILAGIDEATALIRDPDGAWRVAGAGSVTLYEAGADEVVVAAPSSIVTLKM